MLARIELTATAELDEFRQQGSGDGSVPHAGDCGIAHTLAAGPIEAVTTQAEALDSSPTRPDAANDLGEEKS